MRSLTIDLIRIGALLMVMYSHLLPASPFYGVPGLYYVTIGGIGVTLMLIVSGASLELKYGEMERFDYIDFISKRIKRIYPTYLACLAVSAMILFALGRITLGQFGMGDVVMSLTGTYAFSGQWGGVIMPTSWFIGTAMSLYIIYPLLSASLSRSIMVFVVGTLMVSVFYRLSSAGSVESRAMDWNPLCRVFEFGLGMVSVKVLPTKAWMYRKEDLISRLGRWTFPMFLIHPALYVLAGQEIR